MTTTGPRRRTTARVLPVSPDGAVLLLEEVDPADPDLVHYWASIGGARAGDEPAVDAVLRELHEEIGVVAAADALVGPVHEDVQAYSWAGIDHVGENTYFALALPRDTEVSFEHLEPEEVDTVFSARWWTPEDLAGQASYRPPTLPDIMRTAIAAVAGAATDPDGGGR